MSSSDLAIRETILGILKVKDVLKEGRIHTSDFRSAVSDLGFHFGHPIIENILVHCVISVDGFVDYTGLESDLIRERQLQSKSLGNSVQRRGKTSTAAPEKPFRSDSQHHQRVIIERQAKLLQERHNEVYDGYRKYQEDVFNESQFVEYIESLGIHASPNFLHLLRTHRHADFSFAEFIKSLSKYDPNCQKFNSDQPAGGAASYMGAVEGKNREEFSAGLFYARKRLDYSKKEDTRRSVFDKSDGQSRKKLFARGEAGGGGKDVSLHSKVASSENIANALKYDSCGAQQMYSVAHDSMIRGGHQGAQPISTAIGYNSEQKMLREQVLAALRKLEGGEITVVEFEDMIFHMGIEFPEVLVKHLRQNQSTGQLDWTLCVRSLDAHVFKSRLITDQPNLTDVKNIKSRLMCALKELNTTCPLQYLLKSLMAETTGDIKAVSFSEYRQAIRSIVSDTSMVSDDDLRVLFNASDTNGDGRVSVKEFTASMHVTEVSPRRKDIVRQAFFTIDKHEEKQITLSAFLDFFNVNFHPDVCQGLKSEWVVLADVEDYFLTSSENSNGFDTIITHDLFESFVLSMSPAQHSDEDFIALVRNLFTFTALKPPPPQYKMSHGGQNAATPTAKQVFGDFISWNQTESIKEKNQAVRVTRNKIECPYKDSDIIGWAKKDGKVDVPIDVSQYAISRTNLAAGSSDLLEWKTPANGANSKSHALTSWQASSSSSKIKVKEGSSPQPGFSKTNYSWSSRKKEQFSGGCPFGREEVASDENKSQNQLKPRSLADILTAAK